MKWRIDQWAKFTACVCCGLLLAGCAEEIPVRPEGGSLSVDSEEKVDRTLHSESIQAVDSLKEIALKVVDPQGYQTVLKNKEHQGRVILVDFWATW